MWGLFSLGQRLPSLDASENAEATVKRYVLLCGDYLPSANGYYHLLMLTRTVLTVCQDCVNCVPALCQDCANCVPALCQDCVNSVPVPGLC